jgi:hypothetical protein
MVNIFYWNHYQTSECYPFTTNHGEFDATHSWDAQRHPPPHAPNKWAAPKFHFWWIFSQFPHHGQRFGLRSSAEATNSGGAESNKNKESNKNTRIDMMIFTRPPTNTTRSTFQGFYMPIDQYFYKLV